MKSWILSDVCKITVAFHFIFFVNASLKNISVARLCKDFFALPKQKIFYANQTLILNTSLSFLLISGFGLQAQSPEINQTINIRGSFLLFPITPLLTVELRTIDKLTLQLESNFVDTHGVNLKWYWKERMQKDFLFLGVALLENELLREDEEWVYLPYLGYGYALRFGKNQNWTWDSRFGIGMTSNADQNFVFPVLKTGLGKVF